MSDQIVKEIATKVNKKVNIPLLSEKTEQALFESIIWAVLEAVDDIIFSKLSK
jgi:hypothetical protein